VTARADALAALDRLARNDYTRNREGADRKEADLALVRAALAPELPADLAEIQRLADALRAACIIDKRPADMLDVLVAELAERRAAPQLTPEQAYQIFLRLLGRTCEHEAWVALSAIARLHKPGGAEG
jgi:hypothetical protein